MLRQLFLAGFALLLVANNTWAQQASGYNMSVSTGTYSPLGASATVVPDLHSDIGEADVSIGFDFDFEGVTYTTVSATSDGYLSFVPGASSTGGNDLDNGSSARRPLVAPLWDDLDGRANASQAAYEVTGTAPNRVFTFEWSNWEWSWDAADSVVSFQVKLYETTNEISFTYRWDCSSCISGADASIGLSGASSFLSVTGVGSGTPTVSNTTDDNSIDTVVTDQILNFAPPACPAPIAAVLDTSTVDSLAISWTSSASAWNINWGPAGFTQGSPTSSYASVSGSNMYGVNGLTGGTAYDFYLQADCGGSGLSTWAGPFSFYTQCDVQVAPYVEDFNGTGWVSGTGSSNSGFGITSCFEITTEGSYSWGTRSGTTGSSGTGPEDDFSGGANYIFTESSNGSDGDTTSFIGPVVDISSLTDPYLSFTYHMAGADMGTLRVDFYDGAQWQNGVYSISGPQQSTSSETWRKAFVDLGSLSRVSDSIQIRFTAIRGNGFGSDMAIDQFEVTDISCLPSSGFQTYMITSSEVGVSWTPGGGQSFGVEYGPAGFVPGNGSSLGTVDSFMLVSGLSSNTAYDFYLYDSCATSTSSPVGPLSVTTACDAILAPFTEGFEDASGTRNCWNNEYISGIRAWTYGTGSSGGNVGTAYAGTKNAVFSSTSSGYVTRLVSPLIDVSALNTPYLQFFYAQEEWASDQNELRVYVRDAGSSTWTQVFHDANNVSSWTLAEALLPANSDTIQLAFEGYDNFGRANVLDEVQVLEAPPCPDLVGLNASGIADTTATFNWSASGSVTSYQVWFGPQGFYQGSTTTAGTKDFVSTTSYTVDTLTRNSCYEFLVRGICGATNDTSAWVGPASFATNAGALALPVAEGFENGFVHFVNQCDNVSNWMMEQTIVKGGSSSAKLSYIEDDLSVLVLAGYIDLTGTTNPQLSFWHIAKLEGGFDDGLVEISTDGGQTYAVLPDSAYLGNAAGYPSNLLFDEDDYSVWASGATPANSWWRREAFDLSAYKTDSVRVRFKLDSDGSVQRDGWYIDDILIQQVSCATPTNGDVITSTIGADSVQLYWTSGGASDFNVEYGVTGFVQGTGTLVNASNDTTSLTGLQPGTCYEFYVRDSCGVGDVSTWNGPYSFCTNCLPFTAPYLEDFNAGGWVADNAGSAVNSEVDLCWSRNPDNGSDYSWRVRSTSTASSSTGPDQDIKGNGNFVYTEASSGSAADEAELTSPEIDLSSTTSPVLAFGYHFYGADIDRMYIDVFDGSTWNLKVDSVVGEHQASTSDAWLRDTVDLSAYSSGSVKIRFRGIRGSSLGGDMAIDEVYVGDPPTCYVPSNLSASNATSTSVDLSWTTGGASNWNIEYGPIGFSPGSGTQLTNVSNPYTLTGLTAGTCYEFYVQDSCGVGSVSFMAGPESFATQAGQLSFPLTEGFENGFTYFDNNCENQTNWATQQNIVSEAANAAKIAYQDDDTSALEMKGTIDLSSTNSPVLYFEHIAKLEGGYDEAHVQISIDGGATYNDLPDSTYMGAALGYPSNEYFEEDDYSTWGTSNTPVQNTWWQAEQFDLSAYKTSNVRIRFRVNTDGSVQRDGWYVDNIQIVEKPCSAPTNLSANVLTCDSVEISWDSDTGSIGSIMEYGPAGFTPGTGSGTVATNVSSPYIITGLSLDTDYDVYIVDSCSSSSSNVAGPISFKTDSVGPLMASFSYNHLDTTLTSATVAFDASGSTGDGISFDWDFDGSVGNGEQDTATYASNGSYNVTLTVTDRCGNTDDTTVAIVVGGISITENAFSAELSIYPNPNRGDFILNVSDEAVSGFTLEVTDLSGRIILSREDLKVGQDIPVELGNAAPGVYMVRLSGDGFNVTQRVIVH